MKKENIIIAIIAFTLGLLLSLNNCNKKPNSDNFVTIIEYKKEIEHFRDTIYIPKEIYIKEDKSIVRIDETNTYKDSTFKYFNQTFTDSNYILNTFGGFVDSIDLVVKYNDIYIYDSTVITNTITKTNTVFKPFKHTLGVEYMYNTNNNVIVDYTQNFGRIGLSVGTGLNIDNKSLLIKTGLRYSF